MTQDDLSPSLQPALALGLCVMVGLIFGGYLLGTQVRDFKRADRYVAVKGLVERTVKSDSASWSISFKNPGEDLPAVFEASEKEKNAILAFLNSQGFKPSEISVGAVDVTDHSTDENFKKEKGPRFIVEQSITVNTGDVDRVQTANSRTADLIRAGVVVSSGGVNYKFNGLNALKPDMITEATRNARVAADRFAADSGSQVGAIRDADQGTFSISAASAGPDVNDGGAYGGDQQANGSIMKKIRVVSTIDYYLVK